jgi:hypothetical protein
VSYKNSVIAMFDKRIEADSALKQLQLAHFDMKAVSIVGRKAWEEDHPFGFYTAGDRIKFWGSTGAFWGATLGLLFESAFFIFPEIGPLMAAGPVVSWMVAALEGAAVCGGLSAVGAALYSIGIPKTEILHYENSLKNGQFMVLLHGTPDEVTRAHTVLNNSLESQLYLAEAPEPATV